MKQIQIISAFLLLIFSANSFAVADYTFSWSVTGITFDGNTPSTIILDLTEGSNFAAAHGVIQFGSGMSVPLTGTCLRTTVNTAICNLSIDFVSTSMTVDLATLSGTIEIVSYDGSSLGMGTVQLLP